MKSRSAALWVVLALVVGVAPLWATGSKPGRDLPSSHSGADPLAQSAILDHALTSGPGSELAAHAPFFWPERRAAFFMDPLWGQALIAQPWRGADPVWAYTWVLVFTTMLAFAACAALALRLGLSPTAAALAGAVYCAGPIAAGQWHHLNQLAGPWMPAALLAIEAVTRGRRPWFAVVALLLVFAMQLVSSVYASATLLLAVVVWVAVRGVVDRGRGAMLLGALIVALALTAAWARPFLATARDVEGYARSSDLVAAFQARPFDLWKVPTAHLLAWPSHDPLRPALYPGLVWGLMALFAGVGGWRQRRRGPRTALLGLAAAGFVFALGRSMPVPGLNVELPLPFGVLQDRVWPLQALRDPSRFAMMLGLSLALLGAAAVEPLITRFGRRWVGVLVLVALVDLFPWGGERVRVRPDAEESQIIALLSSGSREAPWTLLPLPCSEAEEGEPGARAMTWAARSHRPLATGASGFVPESERARRAVCCDGGVERCLEALAAEGIRTVVAPVSAEWAAPWRIALVGTRWSVAVWDSVASRARSE